MASETRAVRTFAGTGFAEVGGNTADEVITGLRTNAGSLTFADETGLAYHVNKHFDELLEAQPSRKAWSRPQRSQTEPVV